MTRHILGVLGVIAASVLLAVSAMMNYRFGYSLGKTPSDGHIYGMASAAADCFKALVPFFFFAALRNRMWSQAAAAALVWVVVTGYAMTSALGHAALNRDDTNSHRAAAAASYKDLREDLKRARDQLSWLPPHRAAAAVKADIEGLKSQYLWHRSSECAEPAGKVQHQYCQGFRKLEAEIGNALEAIKLNGKIEELTAKIAKASGGSVLAEADPQATVLARILGVPLEQVQTGLTLFVALLIEIGSGFGMYVAFAFWRMHGAPAPAAPPAPAAAIQEVAVRQDAIWSNEPTAPALTAEAGAAPQPALLRSLGDNDNESALRAQIMPPSDVQRFYQEDVVSAPPDNHVPAMKLNEAYKAWCRRNERRVLAMPNFLAEFDELKVEKYGIGGGVKFFGIALRPEVERELEKKAARKRRASHAIEHKPAPPPEPKASEPPEPRASEPPEQMPEAAVAQPKAA
jgi:hypothetical protein